MRVWRKGTDCCLWDGVTCPGNDAVAEVNELVLNLLPTKEHIYFSSDSICSPSGDAENLNIVHPPEFLRNLQLNGTPPTQIIFESRSSYSVIEESS
ncbi:hypothetical protein BDE02_12G009900 [Populus trichocarpa]|nr:hypothetical protein BDE02_12G009900 [Populus trichocarpa]